MIGTRAARRVTKPIAHHRTCRGAYGPFVTFAPSFVLFVLNLSPFAATD